MFFQQFPFSWVSKMHVCLNDFYFISCRSFGTGLVTHQPKTCIMQLEKKPRRQKNTITAWKDGCMDNVEGIDEWMEWNIYINKVWFFEFHNTLLSLLLKFLHFTLLRSYLQLAVAFNFFFCWPPFVVWYLYVFFFFS